ncbi:hypothetical protein ACM44F_003636 [Escherichia coli]|uniref:hypothetical protein n=1 Tax=Escherichia coli TaxID=562 RepID=UPI000E261144|nr:hypothetical protein [Escherichia coli]EGP4644933.1 hypothetical protein [Escherichia coli]EKO1479531.1 hypothetical protein [Escherichia coli]ELW7753051.1 hypothetical protein [Escherichia coli]EMA4624462.1 hypothetical protein [Escherichia coli]MCU9633568.1 hypothetical protein [Escherichia coli]
MPIIFSPNTLKMEQYHGDRVKMEKYNSNPFQFNAVYYTNIDDFKNLLKDLINTMTNGKVEFNSEQLSKLMSEITSFESNLDGTPKDINFISQNEHLRQTVSIRQDGLCTKITLIVEETHFDIDHGDILHGKKWSETRVLPEELNMAIVVENLRNLPHS